MSHSTTSTDSHANLTDIDESAVRVLRALQKESNGTLNGEMGPEVLKNGTMHSPAMSQADNSLLQKLQQQLGSLSQAFAKHQSQSKQQIQTLQQQLSDTKRAHRQQIEELKMGFELRMREFLHEEMALGGWMKKDATMEENEKEKSSPPQKQQKRHLKTKPHKSSPLTTKKRSVTANGTAASPSPPKTSPQDDSALITRETLENLTQLIESRAEELTYLVDMFTTQETTINSDLKQSIRTLEQHLDELRQQLKQFKYALHEEEETVLSLATQSSSLKECITAEIEENLSFRKKLKLTMDHYSEQFKSLHQKTGSFATQLKMLQNQVMHMEKSKRDKLTKDEDLYQIYMEQASVYDQRFRSLRTQQSKMERKVQRISHNLHAFITNVWYQVPEEFQNNGDIRLHKLVYHTVRDYHTANFFDIGSQQQQAGPIRIQPIRPQQYRIHDRNLTIIEQNDVPIVKLRDGTLTLEDYLKRLFPAVVEGSVASPRGGRSSLSNNNMHHYPAAPSGASTPRGEFGDADRHRTPHNARSRNTPPTNRNPENGHTPTLKVDLTGPRSPALSKIVNSRDGGGGMVKLRVNLSELSGGSSQ